MSMKRISSQVLGYALHVLGLWLLADSNLLPASSQKLAARSQEPRSPTLTCMRGESQTPETCELDEDNLFLDLSPEYTISIK
ncbi:MAG: hypothetical protein PVJ41_04685 [Desulfobacterales bacterium]|jgi:hypothetical protein